MSRTLTAPLAALAAFALACSNSSTPAQRPTRRPDAGSGPATTNPPRTGPPPGRGARVVVDLSESLRGFAANNSVALESLHRAIEAALSTSGMHEPFERCGLVDNTVQCASTPELTPERLRVPATYNAHGALIDLALRRPPRAARSDQQQADPMDERAATVLVTDGFQSGSDDAPAGDAGAPSAEADVNCPRGTDPGCIANLLRRRVVDGYGVWALRVLLPFNGRYFTERGIDQNAYTLLEQHVEALNHAPEWDGLRFALARRRPSFSRPLTSFEYQGPRPLLVFVLSRQIEAGRALVSTLLRDLEANHVGVRFGPSSSQQPLASAEWAPFAPYSAALTNARRANNGGPADEVQVERVTRQGSDLLVNVHCSQAGVAQLQLTGSLTQGALPVPSFVTVQARWQAVGTLPRGVLTPPTDAVAGRPGTFNGTTQLDCRTLAAGTHRYVLGVWGRWSLNNQLDAEWFLRESAANMFEAPEHVFGLGDVARTVLTEGTNYEGILTRVTLEVHRD